MANETETGPEPPKGEPGATSVVIFGAGITGLTAAHELADRGFRVTVYDPSWLEPYEAADVDGTASDGRLGYEPCGIGGIARSRPRPSLTRPSPLRYRGPIGANREASASGTRGGPAKPAERRRASQG